MNTFLDLAIIFIFYKSDVMSYVLYKTILMFKSGFIPFDNHRSAPLETPMPNATNDQLSREQQIAALEKDWASNPRWKGITRNYSAADVVRLRGSVHIEHTLAQRGAEKL